MIIRIASGSSERWYPACLTIALRVMIYPNCSPARCGGWELIEREDMLEQSAKEGLDLVLTFVMHKTAKMYGPLNKWEPERLF